jgi:hypothetical protein
MSGQGDGRPDRKTIDAELDARIADYEKDGGADGRLTLLAEGDSWFDYPIGLPDEIAPTDTIAQLERALNPFHTRILNLAHHGDAMSDMMDVVKRARLEQMMARQEFDALLFSAGGNDIAGEKFSNWLRTAAGPGDDPGTAADEHALGGILDQVMDGYAALAALRDRLSPGRPIFVHAYDFARPTGIRICALGPWLKPGLVQRGWMTGNSSIPNVDRGAIVVKSILLRFHARLQDFAAKHDNIVVVTTQGLLSPGEWVNELHPTAPGFMKVAGAFRAALKARFGNRVMDRPGTVMAAASGAGSAG